MSPKYGMNTFLKRTVKMLGLENTYYGYVEVLPKISRYRLLIVGANGKGKGFIRKLEKLFHVIYEPRLNCQNGLPKTYKQVSTDEVFSLAVSACPIIVI